MPENTSSRGRFHCGQIIEVVSNFRFDIFRQCYDHGYELLHALGNFSFSSILLTQRNSTIWAVLPSKLLRWWLPLSPIFYWFHWIFVEHQCCHHLFVDCLIWTGLSSFDHTEVSRSTLQRLKSRKLCDLWFVIQTVRDDHLHSWTKLFVSLWTKIRP